MAENDFKTLWVHLNAINKFTIIKYLYKWQFNNNNTKRFPCKL